MKLLLVCLVILFGNVKGDCNQADCGDCLLQTGCNWCETQVGGSFCSDATSAGQTGSNSDSGGRSCNGNGIDTQDQFITEAEQCFGGCASAEYCSSCSQTPYNGVCGWCYDEETCVVASGHSCSIFNQGSCTTPCNGRDGDCVFCLQDSTCSWCGSTSTCSDASLNATCSGGAWSSSQSSNCPVPPQTAAANTQLLPFMLLFGAILFVLVAIGIYVLRNQKHRAGYWAVRSIMTDKKPTLE